MTASLYTSIIGIILAIIGWSASTPWIPDGELGILIVIALGSVVPVINRS